MHVCSVSRMESMTLTLTWTAVSEKWRVYLGRSVRGGRLRELDEYILQTLRLPHVSVDLWLAMRNRLLERLLNLLNWERPEIKVKDTRASRRQRTYTDRKMMVIDLSLEPQSTVWAFLLRSGRVYWRVGVSTESGRVYLGVSAGCSKRCLKCKKSGIHL